MGCGAAFGMIALNSGTNATGGNITLHIPDYWDEADADVTTTNSNPGDAGFGVPDGDVNGGDLSFFVESWLGGGCP